MNLFPHTSEPDFCDPNPKSCQCREWHTLHPELNYWPCQSDIPGLRVRPIDFESYLRNCLPPFEINRNTAHNQEVGFSCFRIKTGVVKITVTCKVSKDFSENWPNTKNPITEATRRITVTNERWENRFIKEELLRLYCIRPGQTYKNLLVLTPTDRTLLGYFKPKYKHGQLSLL